MKNIILTFVFLISSLVAFSQSTFIIAPNEYGSFKVSSQAQCGLGSVYCMVTRSNTTNEYGNYIYQVWFATNSYFPNCQASRTYIPDISIWYFDGKYWNMPYNYFSFWMTVGQTSLGYTLFHPNPYLQIKISTGVLQPTAY